MASLKWEDGKMHLGTIQAALPFEMVNGELIYKSEYVRAIDPTNPKGACGAWRIWAG